MDNQPMIIALTGLPGSGKGTVAAYLAEKYQAANLQFSGPLREVIKRLYQSNERRNLQDLAAAFRNIFGGAILAKVLYKDAQKSGARLVVMEGLRHQEELLWLRQQPNFRLVAIEASIENRFNRIKQRGENADDTSLTMDVFRQQHAHASDRSIEEIMATADARLDNNGVVADLQRQIDELIGSL